MEGYKYYSTQRPVDLMTYPKPKDNEPLEITNYDCNTRQRIPGEGIHAWGELIYTKPLTEKEMNDYELQPSRRNPDIREIVEDQAQRVGKCENEYKIPDRDRLTKFDEETGTFVVKEGVTVAKLALRNKAVIKVQERS